MEGYIQIAQCHATSSKIASKHSFFSGEIIIRRTEDGLEFRKPTLGYVGKVHKGAAGSSGWRNFSFNQKLPLGRFEFNEEESSEDVIVVTFNQPNNEQES